MLDPAACKGVLFRDLGVYIIYMIDYLVQLIGMMLLKVSCQAQWAISILEACEPASTAMMLERAGHTLVWGEDDGSVLHLPRPLDQFPSYVLATTSAGCTHREFLGVRPESTGNWPMGYYASYKTPLSKP